MRFGETLAAAVLGAMLLAAPAFGAVTATWNGGGASPFNWSDTNDWVGNIVPGSITLKTNADTAVFNGTGSLANTTVTIDVTTQNIGNITFDLAASPAYTIGSFGPNSGNSLFLTSGGTIQLTATVGAITDTINAPLLLEGSYTFANNSTNAASLLAINGNVALDTGISTSSVLTVTGADGVTIAGTISNGGTGGATLGLTKTGANTLTLTAANTYAGINTLNAGVINLGSAELAGTSGPLGKSAAANPGNIVLTGGTLQYTTSNSFDYSGRFATTGTQQYRADINGQNVTWASNLVSAAGAITLSSTAGGGTLNLTGANTFTGGVTINNGTLQVGSAGALNAATANTVTLANNGILAINGFNPTIQNLAGSVNTVVENANNNAVANAILTVNSVATTTFAGTLQDGGAGGTLGLTKNGSNNLVLSHANTFSGPTVVNGGVLAYFAAGSQGNTSSITLNAGGTFTDGPSATAGVGPFIPLATLAALITPTSTGTFGIGFNNPDTEDLSPLTAPVFLGAGSGNFSTFNGILPAVSGNYRFGGGGVGQLAINSSGTGNILSGSNGVIVQGLLKTSSASAAGTLSTWNTLANNGAGGSGGGAATIAGGGTIELQGQNTYTGDTQVNVATNNPATFTQAILQVNNSSIVSGGTLISGPIGVGNLHISGGGIQDGGLPVVLNNNVVIDGNAIFSSQGNGTLTFSPVGLTTAPTVALSNNPSFIVKNIATTIADNITGSSGFTTSGIGNLILSGTNTYTGPTTINPATATVTNSNGGTQTVFNLGFGGVQFNSPASIGGSGNGANGVTVNAGAYVAAGPNYTNLQTTFFNRIVPTSTGTIALTASTADNFDWSAAGANFTAAGLGAAFGSNVTYSGTLTPNGTTYFLGGGGGTLNFASPISGTNSVSLFNSNMNGIVVLGGANTYSGGTTVSATDLASYFNPGNGNNTNPGNLIADLQVASNSAVSGSTLVSGPIGTGPVKFVNSSAIEDNGTNITLANSVVVSVSSPFTTAFTAQPMAFNSAGNGSLTFDGPGATISLAPIATTTSPATSGQTWAVNNLTTIKDPITGTLHLTTGNQYFTISGTGTLVLAEQGTWSYDNFLASDNTINHSTLLVAGPTVRFGASSTVTGTFGSQTLVSGPLGKGALSINGAGNVGSFLQDNGANITLANSFVMNLGNPIKFDSTGAGSITLDGTGLSTPAFINILGTNTLTLLADNTVIINDKILGGNAATAAILTIGNNNNTFPYGTVVLNSNGSTYSGGTNANYATTIIGNNPVLTGAAGSQTLASGPLGTGTFTIGGNYPIVQDNGTAITVANNVNLGGNSIIGNSGTGSLIFDGTGRSTKATFNLTATNNWVVNGTVQINDQVTGGQNFAMAGSGKLILNNTSGTASSYNAISVNSGLVQVNSVNSFGTAANNNTIVNFGGTLAAGPAYTSLQTTFFNRIQAKSATGTVAITANSSDNYDWGGVNAGSVNFLSESFGAVGGSLAAPIVYSGTLTPNGTVYRLGGGGGVLQMANALTNSDSLIVGGGGSGGTVILASATPYTGSTFVNLGTLQLNTASGSGSITVGPGASIAGNFSSLTTNLLPLIAANSNGTLALTGASSENLNFSATPNMGLGAEPVAGGVTYSGTLSSAGGTYRVGGGGGVLTVSSALTGASSVVAFGGGSGGTLILTGPNTFSGGATLLPGTTLSAYFGGPQQAAIVAAGNNPAAGVLQLNSGATISAGAIASGPVGTGTLSLGGGTLQDNGTAITVANSIALIGSTTLSSATPGTGSLTFDGTSLTSPSTFNVSNGAILTVTNTTNATTIKDAITGSTGFTKTGNGTLILSGANNYTGPTNILYGTLRAGASNTLPSGTTLNIALGPSILVSPVAGASSVVNFSGTFDLNGTTQSVDQLTGTGIVTNNNPSAGLNPSTLTIGGAGGSSQFYGTIQNGATNTVSVIKSGAGILTLGSANTYSGGTTLSGGTLRLAPAGTGVLQMGGAGTTLTNASGSTAILNGPVGTGTLTLSGGTLQDSGYATNLANSVSLGGSVTFSSPSLNSAFGSPNSGSLVFDGTALATPATVNLTAPATLAVNNSTTIADQITGASGITMSGSGTLVLSSTTQSTYTTMAINSGVVQYNAATAGGSGNITVNIGGTAAAGPGMGVSATAGATSTPIGSMLPFIATSSAGTIALTGNDSENVSFSGFNSLSLGATGNATYSGTLTPAGSTYLLGGGGGTLTVTSALSGSDSLTVGGSAAGGSGGTVVLTNPLNSTTTVNSGILQLNASGGTGAINVGSGGAVSIGPAYAATSATPISSSLLPLINTGSAGTLALTGSIDENLNLASYPNLSVGATPGTGAAYNGTLTPAGTTYRLGGGGGTLTMNSALTGGNSLVVGSGSGGNVILNGTANTFSAGTTVSNGTLSVGPNPGALGSGAITLGTGATLAILPYSAPLAATGYNYDEILGPGEGSVQSGVTASFGDAGYALYQHGVPGSQGVGNLGLPASRSFVSFSNNDTTFQLQPYNAKNALKLGIGGGVTTVGGTTPAHSANSDSYSPQGTLTLKNPGQYQSISLLNGSPFGATFFEVQLNFADGTSILAPNTAGNLPNYYAADWTGTTNFNINTNNFQLAYLGAGSITQTDNSGTFQGGSAGGIFNAMAAPNPKLYETDVQVPLADQGKTLTSVTVIDTGAFNGSNNSVDYLHATNQLNIMGISGTLLGSSIGTIFYSNAINLPAGSSPTIDVQNAQGVTFTGGLNMGAGSTLNVINSTGTVSTGAIGSNGVQPYMISLTGTVQLPTSGLRTATFNAAGSTGEVLSVGIGSNPVNLVLGGLQDDGTTPETINFTGAGIVTLNGFSSLVTGTHANISGGGSVVLASSGGLASTTQVNIASGSTLVSGGNATVSSLAGGGTVQLSAGTNNGTLTVGSFDNLSTTFAGTFVGAGTVQNGGSGNTLTLNGGNFASTTVASNSSATLPSVVAGSTMALGNNVILNGGILQLQATPGKATMTGFGGNYGIPNQNGNSGSGVQSNGWTVNSIGFLAAGVPLNNVPNAPYSIFPSINVLQLTDGGGSESRNAFYSTPVPYANASAGFVTSFTYTPGLQNQADGMTFILQNDPRGAGALAAFGVGTTGGSGAQKGYGGISNSIAIYLDMFQNGSPGGTGTALGINGGNTPISIPVKWLADGDPINVTLAYSPTAQTLTETLIDTLVPANTFSNVYTGVNLNAILGGPTAYVGFGGGTGGQFVNQQISNFSYSLSATTPASYATGVVMSGTSSTIDLAATAATPNFSMAGLSGSGTLTVSAATAPTSLNYGLTFTAASSLSGTLTVNPTKPGNGSGTGVGAVTFAAQVSGAGGITNNGPGNVVLSALNTFTGGSTTAAGTTIATAPGALSSGAVNLSGGILRLATPQPYSAPVVLGAPISATGWNQDVVVGANQGTATVFPTLASFDGTGISHAPGNVLYQIGTPGSGGVGGLPANGVIGDVTTPNAFNPNVKFQLQPYSTVSGGLVNNDLQLNNTNLAGTLTLAAPGKYSALNILNATGNGPGSFEMQLNFTDAPPLVVGATGGTSGSAVGYGIFSPDWFNTTVSNAALVGVGRYGGGTNFNGAPTNPRLFEYDYAVPLAYQNDTLESITFDYGAGGEVNIMAVSGTPLTTDILNAVNVTSDSTIDVTGTAASGLGGLATIGANTLHVTGGSTGNGAAYTLSVGTSGGVSLTGNPIFDVANNSGGSGLGTLILGALNDNGTARTIEFHGTGATTLASAATSLVQGTIITIDSGSTLNSNAAGTATAGGSLGQFAQVSVASSAKFTIGATQTISALTGSGSVAVGNGKTLTIGNTDNLASTFSGVISDSGVGSINVGVPGSTGSLTLTNGNNTYTGSTTVTGGTLFLQASANNISHSSTINVLSGATLNVTGVTGGFTVANNQTLQGASILGGPGGGTVSGAATIGSGGAIGGTSTPTTSLTLAVAGAGPALTLQASSSSNFTISGALAGAGPMITTTSGSGQSLSITGADTVNVSPNSLLPTLQSTFQLFGYTGTQLSSGQFANFTLGTQPSSPTLNYSYALSNQAGHVDLVVTPLGLTWAGVDNPATTGTPVDNAWNTSSNNWVNSSGGSAVFSAGSQVVFADSYVVGGSPVSVSSPQNVVVQAGGVSTTGVTFGASSVLYAIKNTAGDLNGIAGAGGVNLVGTSAVTFDSANSFSGAVLIANGQLNLGDGSTSGVDAANALGQSSSVTVVPGAALNLNAQSGQSLTFGNLWNGSSTIAGTVPLTISGSGSGASGIMGALNSSGGNNTYTGQISIGSIGATIAATSGTAGNDLALSGGINGATAATVTFTGPRNISESGAITDSGVANALSVALTGPGDLTLSGASTYHGSTSISSGLLILTSAGSVGHSSGVTIPAAAGLVLQNSGAAGTGVPLSLSGIGTGTAIPGTAFTSSGALTSIGASGYAGAIGLAGDTTITTTSPTDLLTLSGPMTIGTGGMSQTLSLTGPGAMALSGSIGNASVSAIGSIVVNTTLSATNPGTVTFSGANAYSGTTMVNSGALILQNAAGLGNSSLATVSAGTGIVLQNLLVNTQTFGTVALNLSGTGTGFGTAATGASAALTGIGTGVAGSNNTYPGSITIGSAGAMIATAGANDLLTLSGPINGSAGNTTFSSPGTITVTGAINSTGFTTTLTGAGTININNGLNLTNAGALVVGTGGTGAFNVNNQLITDGGTLGTVTMAGTGTLNLTNVNDYSGGTTISSTAGSTGKVVASNTSSLGTGPVTLGGGILRLNTATPAAANFGTSTSVTGAGTSWVVNNTVITVTPMTANVLTLTDSNANEARSAWYNTALPISAGFTAKYTYTPSAGTATRADGAAFVLQHSGTAALGGAGGALGVGGITPSDELEFNLYTPNTVGQAFHTNGATGGYAATGSVNLNSGDAIDAVITYVPATTTLNETLTDETTHATFTASIVENLVTDLGSNLAFIGFTGGTGGSNSTQKISNFSFVAGGVTPTYGNNVVLNAGATSAIDVVPTSALPTVTMGSLTVGATTGGAASTLNVTNSTVANQTYGLTLGAVTLNNNVTFNVANNGTGKGTLTLGALSDGGSNQVVTVNGAGTVLLNTVATSMGSGSSIGIGGTVPSGNLVVTNATGSPTGFAAVNVNNGGTLSGSFTGTGSIAGLVTVNGGGTILGSNAAALAGTPLSIGGTLTLGGTGAALAATNSFASFSLTTTPNVATPPTTNKGMIVASGGLAVSGTDTVLLTGSAPATFTLGQKITYDLIDYTGSLSSTQNGSGLSFGGVGSMNLGSLAGLSSSGAYAFQLVNNTSLSQIDVVLTPAPLTWTGASSGAWDINTTSNWATTANIAAKYTDGAAVLFADKNPITSATITNTTVTIVAGGVLPGLVSFVNTGPSSGVNYTIQNAATGVKGIGGITTVSMSGAGGQVTFLGANSYSGPTQILAGQINLGDLEVIGTTNYSLALGNTFGVTVSTGGTLQLQGASGAARTFGTGYNGGGLVAGSLTTPIGLTLSGGALNSALGNNTYVGPITIGTPGATIASNGVPANGDALTLSGVIGDGGAGNPIIITGGGVTNFTAANTYFGSTTVNPGTLVLANAAALGNSSGATVNSGGTMLLTGGTVATPRTFGNFAGGGGTIPLTLNGTGVSGAGALGNSGVNTWTGAITLASNSTIATTAATDVLTLTGGIGGSGALTATGPGTLNVGGGNTYGGGTIVNATGTVIGGSTGAFGTNTLTLNAGTVRVAPIGNATVNGFGGTGTGWTANGNSSFPSSNVLQLTPPAGGTSSAFFNTPVAYQAGGTVGFTSTFTYQALGGSTAAPADGVTFTLQNDSRGAAALGGGGGQLGYTGITPSAAVEFNIYPPNNPTQTSPLDGGTIFATNGTIGTAATNISTLPVSIANQTNTPSDPINVTLVYNPTTQTLTETLADPTAGTNFTHTYTGVNLASVLGNNGSAFVGFTGATGGSIAQQQISNFQYTNGLPLTYPNTILGGTDTSTIDVAGAAASGPAVTFGTLTVGSGGAATLNVTDATDTAGAAYNVTFGATTLGSNVTFNVANAALGANGTGTLTLGAVGDGGSGFSIAKTGTGALVLTAPSTYSGSTTVTNGTLTTTSTGSISNAPLVLSAASGITSVVNLGSNQSITSLSGTLAGTGSATLNVASGTTLTDTQSTSTAFPGKVALASTATLTKAGVGTLEIDGAPSLGAGSIVNVNAGSVKFNVATGSATVGAGVIVNVNGSATLELANSVSALSDGTAAHSAQINNNSSAAAGLLVSGTTSVQRVGGIDGAGATQVNAGNSLTANHIVQGALIIGGTSTSAALVTIDASDASGNPLVESSGLAVAGSLDSNSTFASDTTAGTTSLVAGSDSPATGSSLAGSAAASGASLGAASVPEPSTVLLLVLGSLACLVPAWRRRIARK